MKVGAIDLGCGALKGAIIEVVEEEIKNNPVLRKLIVEQVENELEIDIKEQQIVMTILDQGKETIETAGFSKSHPEAFCFTTVVGTGTVYAAIKYRSELINFLRNVFGGGRKQRPC